MKHTLVATMADGMPVIGAPKASRGHAGVCARSSQPPYDSEMAR